MVTISFDRFGELVVDGKVYYSDMIVWWDGELEFVTKNHMLGMETFAMMLRKKPEIIVVGTGQQGCVRISDEVRHRARDKKIRVFEGKSDSAAKMFSDLAVAGKRVVAFIHTTC